MPSTTPDSTTEWWSRKAATTDDTDLEDQLDRRLRGTEKRKTSQERTEPRRVPATRSSKRTRQATRPTTRGNRRANANDPEQTCLRRTGPR